MNVIIIYNKEDYCKENIIDELKAENYKHNFLFFDKINDLSSKFYITDEVWVFGKCSEFEEYKLADKVGMDIWQMG